MGGEHYRPGCRWTIIPFSPLAHPCMASGKLRPKSEDGAIDFPSLQVRPASVVR